MWEMVIKDKGYPKYWYIIYKTICKCFDIAKKKNISTTNFSRNRLFICVLYLKIQWKINSPKNRNPSKMPFSSCILCIDDWFTLLLRSNIVKSFFIMHVMGKWVSYVLKIKIRMKASLAQAPDHWTMHIRISPPPPQQTWYWK